ncbi:MULTISPECIES: O-antigen ligase [Bacillus cereus group]|uniref:O-antigen ligase family protein n=1 Tax=Bacillus cereus group TaxID=86661 RepID=UPI00111E3DF5|nr:MULTISPECIES: O-antigen ligase family protein [Bacillus cereus group]MDW3038838.1 O-antigen ligase family protein [Bacillus pacificus]TNP03322.1 capsular biosynthesis protein [Bacillus pacificus]
MKRKELEIEGENDTKTYVYNSIFIILVSLFILYVPVINNMQSLVKAPYNYYANFLLIFILGAYKFYSYKKVTFTKEYLQSMGCLYVLALYCSVSSFWSDIQFETLWRALIIFGPIFTIAYIINIDQTIEKTLITSYRIQMLVGCFLSIVMIFIKTFGSTVWFNDEYSFNYINFVGVKIEQAIYYSGSTARFSSITGNPNILSYILLISLAVTLLLFLRQSIKVSFFIVVFLIQFYALILTYSRTGILAFGIFLFLLFWLNNSKGMNGLRRVIWKFMRISLIIAVFVGIIAALVLNGSNQRFSLDLAGRGKAWDLLIEVISNNFFFGIGFNSSQELLRGMNVGVNHAHSLYLGITAEIGIIGLGIFLFFICYTLWMLIQKFQKHKNNLKDKDQWLMYSGNIALVIAILIHQITEFSLLRNNYLNFLWFFFIFATLKLGSYLTDREKGRDSVAKGSSNRG